MRYRAGEHRAVWAELRHHAASDVALRLETEAVAAEMMQRVARNADRLAQRLANHGWQALGGDLRILPAPDDARLVQEAEQLTRSPLPISLTAFWRIVGGIDFVWNYESNRQAPALCGAVALDQADPLCVDPAANLFWQLKEWRDDPPDFAEGETWQLGLAPDHLHKANISGGAAYGAELPAHPVDFAFRNERHNLDFVDYLRLAFQWAGFPGLEDHPYAKVRDFIEAMKADLEPF